MANGGFESNFIPRKEVVTSDSKPTNTFEGLWWFDTTNNSIKYYNGTEFITPGNDLTNIYEFMNDAAATQERHDLELSINSWNYDDGFIDIFWDKSKISSSSNVNITTGSNGNVKLPTKASSDLNSNGYTNSNSYDRGVTINPNEAISNIEYTVATGCSGLSRALVVDNSGNILGSKTGVSAGDTVTFTGLNLSSGSDYHLVVDDQGNSWTYAGASQSFPVTNSAFDITQSVYDAKRTGNFGTSTSNAYAITGVTRPGSTSGSVTHTRKDLGFTPSKLVANPEYDSSSTGESVEMVVSDNSGNSVTLTESDFETEFSVNFSDGNIQIEPQLAGNGTSSPKWNKTQIVGVQ